METSKPSNPLLSFSSFVHQHCLRLSAELASRLDDTRRLAGNWPSTALRRSRPVGSLPFASVSQESRQAKRDLGGSLSSDHVAKSLAGTAVYTVSNSNNEFVLISDPNGIKSIGLLCFRQEDAEAFLAQVQSRKRELKSQARVVPISLDQVYMLKVEGIAFRFLPDPVQIRNALAAEKVFNQDVYFKKAVKHVGEPMTHLESIASSAVRAAIKVKASVIVCFTSSGRAARLIAKYRPTMPVISVVIPQLKTNQLRWTFSGAFEARQSLIVRGIFSMLADPRHPAESTSATNETILKVALDHGKAFGIIKSHDRVVVCQKIGDASVVKIIELED